ncbi:hypothetical protein ACVDG8_030565 [Mesorhizobium sp. ORM8.1]
MTAPMKPAQAASGSIASGLDQLLKRPLIETIFRRRTPRQPGQFGAGRQHELCL